MTRPGLLAAAGLALVLGLTGCGGGTGNPPKTSASPSASESADASACDGVTTRLLASVQTYIDAYGATLSGSPDSSSSGDTATGDDTELRSSLQVAQTDLAANGCDLADFRTDFASGLEEVTAKGPLARAVLLRLIASMTGTLSTTPQTIELTPGDDLARRLSALAPGSTARFAAGEYRLRQPLVLLAGITLHGAGKARTTLSSRAGGSALLVLTDGRVELRDLALVHTGKAPASVLVGGPSSSIVLTAARVSGGRAAKGAAGQAGTGVSMTAREADTTSRGTTLQVTRSDFTGNDAAGILLTGAHRASVRGTTFRDNGQCGICFAGVSSGAARNSTFTDNTVGVAVFDRAAPVLADDTFTGGQVGIQVSGKGAPQVTDVTVDGASKAGFIYSEDGNGRVDGATCTRTPYGIVVGPKSYPFLAKTDCQLAKGK